jgi:hypothetical protein
MSTKKTLPSNRQLTPQQKYLLQRIPSQYRMNGYKERPEPTEVKRARKLIERWDKEEATLRCRADQRNDALVRKAREAVYFDKPEKALAIVQQCEKMLKGCGE